MRFICTIAICFHIFTCAGIAEAAETAIPATGETTRQAWLVFDTGRILRCDSAMNVLVEGKPYFEHRRYEAVQCADLLPSSKRIVLGVRRESSPVMLLEADTLEPIELGSLVFPPPKPPYGIHYPVWVNAVSNDSVYLVDEAYASEPDPFSQLLIDIDKMKVEPLKESVAGPKEVTVVTPGGQHMMTYVRGELRWVATLTAETIWRCTLGNVNPRFFKVDWNQQHAIVYLTRSLQGGKRQYEMVAVDLRSGLGQGSVSPEKDPLTEAWDSAIWKPILQAYAAAQGRLGTTPIVDEPLRAALKCATFENITELPTGYRQVYFSPDGRRLLAVYHRVQTVETPIEGSSSEERKQEDPASSSNATSPVPQKVMTEMRVLDIANDELLGTFSWDGTLVTVLFAPPKAG